MQDSLLSVSHRRFNPLTNSWVLVSPHRTKRPWSGKNEATSDFSKPIYDPTCYLCPNNKRANGDINPDYKDVFVFNNDYPALINDKSIKEKSEDSKLFISEPASGTCRVICFSPRHDLTMAKMAEDKIKTVIDIWQTETKVLSKNHKYVQIFENKGEIMGCSNPHPHGQIWATSFLPLEIQKESESQGQYFLQNKSLLLLDYLNLELELDERIIYQNKNWAAVVPYWALWPFESLVIPKKPLQTMMDLKEEDKLLLSDLIKTLLSKYDKLFNTDFPYSMGWHGAPYSNKAGWLLHAHYYPPLLRSSAIKKFMVGFEMLAEPQRDLTPEEACKRLKQL